MAFGQETSDCLPDAEGAPESVKDESPTHGPRLREGEVRE